MLNGNESHSRFSLRQLIVFQTAMVVFLAGLSYWRTPALMLDGQPSANALMWAYVLKAICAAALVSYYLEGIMRDGWQHSRARMVSACCLCFVVVVFAAEYVGDSMLWENSYRPAFVVLRCAAFGGYAAVPAAMYITRTWRVPSIHIAFGAFGCWLLNESYSWQLLGLLPIDVELNTLLKLVTIERGMCVFCIPCVVGAAMVIVLCTRWTREDGTLYSAFFVAFVSLTITCNMLNAFYAGWHV